MILRNKNGNRMMLGPHDNDAVRAARLGYNTLLQLIRNRELQWRTHNWVREMLTEMNRNGMFDKFGQVTPGPVADDVDDGVLTDKELRDTNRIKDLRASAPEDHVVAWVDE